MHRAKAFFFVCLGILCLVAAYHFGATSATAQAPGNPVIGVAGSIGTMPQWIAVTANGDTYCAGGALPSYWEYRCNVFSSGPTQAQSMSMGQLKAKYATPRPTE